MSCNNEFDLEVQEYAVSCWALRSEFRKKVAGYVLFYSLLDTSLYYI